MCLGASLSDSDLSLFLFLVTFYLEIGFPVAKHNEDSVLKYFFLPICTETALRSGGAKEGIAPPPPRK